MTKRKIPAILDTDPGVDDTLALKMAFESASSQEDKEKGAEYILFAAQAGTVVISQKKTGGYAGGYGAEGEYVVIDHHNGYYTMYAHMCPGCRAVKVGDYVEKGQVIGGMGQTGWATGVHVHFAFWQGNVPYGAGSRSLDPLLFY